MKKGKLKRHTVKGLQEDLKFAKSQMRQWRDKYYYEQKEKQQLKEWVKEKFDWWIELSATQKSPCLKFLIKNTAKILGMKE